MGLFFSPSPLLKRVSATISFHDKIFVIATYCLDLLSNIAKARNLPIMAIKTKEQDAKF